MNEQTEEMMMRYMEGTLSPEESLRFESLLLEQPALADELRALQSFDEALANVDSGAQWLDKVDIGFLSDVQSQMAQVAASFASVASAASVSATNAAVSSSAVSSSVAASSGSFAVLGSAAIGKIALSLLACGLLGYGAWKFAVAPSNGGAASETSGLASSDLQPRAQQESLQEAATPNEQEAVSNPAPQDDSRVISTNNGRAGAISPNATLQQSARQSSLENAAAEPPPPSHENLPHSALGSESETQAQQDQEKSRLQASIESSSAQDLRAKIDQLAAQVKTKEQSGDRLGVAFDAKKLGMLERAAGRYAESYESLSKALKAAQGLKVRELEGEILAETAVLHREQGNNDKALQTLHEAIALLAAEKSSKTARWEREYERWGGK